jgi:uncharacterized protein (TIGR02246 family)
MSVTLMHQVFAAVDAGDAAGFAGFFAPDGHLVFGNDEPLIGRDAIAGGLTSFLSTIGSLRHAVVREWDIEDTCIVELKVTYHRLDGSSVTIPVVSIVRTGQRGLIEDYRVYYDLAPLYAD